MCTPAMCFVLKAGLHFSVSFAFLFQRQRELPLDMDLSWL